MKKYYYVKTRLTPGLWEEMIVSQDDPEVSIIPHLLIWRDGCLGDVEENPIFQVHYRKKFGEWEQVHYSFTYLSEHIVIDTLELEKIEANNLPLSFSLSE